MLGVDPLKSGADVDEYAVDAPLGEVLRWLKEDAARASPRLWIRASKEYSADSDFEREDFGVGEDDDLNVVVVRGAMEVRPRRGVGGWVLRLRAEDTVGLHVTGEEEGYDNDDSMSLEAFEEQFILAERGEIELVVAVGNAEAKQRFERWLGRHLARPEG